MTSSSVVKNAPINNVAAERAALAGISRYGLEVFAEVSPILNEDCFSVPENKVMYTCLKHVLSKQNTVDFSSLLASAEAIGLSDFVNKPGVLKHFEAVLNTPIKIENVYEHAATTRRLDFARKLQDTTRDIWRAVSGIEGSETISQILSLAESPIQQLAISFLREDQSRPQLIGNELDQYLAHVLESPCDQIGLSSGFSCFDKALGGGLRRKCVDVVGARPGVGKSIFADNVAVAVASKGVPVLMLDTEMGNEDHWNRLLAKLSGVQINNIGTGRFGETPETKAKVLRAGEELKKLPYYYLNVSGRHFDEITSIMRRWVLKEVGYDDNGTMRDCLLIYDYLKMMTSESITNSMAEFQALGFQITNLHNFCVEYDVPCLTFVQLNRDGITKESTDAASGSDRIIWLCTSFSIFKEKTEEEIASDTRAAGNMKLIPLKTRHGPGMTSGYICLQKNGSIATLTELGNLGEVANRVQVEKDGFEQVGNSTPEGFSELSD